MSLKIKSQALEANIASYHVDVTVDPKYSVLQDIMSKYFGVMEGLTVFLKELSHPYKNWRFIVQEARGYALDYFHLLNPHPKGGEAAGIFLNIFLAAIEADSDLDTKIDAVDNLLLYIQTIIRESKPDMLVFLPVVNKTLESIRKYDGEYFFLFVKSYYQLNRLAKEFLHKSPDDITVYRPMNLLLIKYFKVAYEYWLAEEDPGAWFEKEMEEDEKPLELDEIFEEISHHKIKKHIDELNSIENEKSTGSLEALEKLSGFPGFNEFVELYRRIPQRLADKGKNKINGQRLKIIFLFHIMTLQGLSIIHEEALREINNTLSWLIAHEHSWNVNKLVNKTFEILKDRSSEFPTVALNSILNMGKGVYKTDESDLVKHFIESVIDLGFHSPMISGVGDDWQVKVDSAHLQNVKTWLELIEKNPQWSTRLISYLTIHLALCGIFVKDTDLFPRNITQILNSRIEPVYNLIKQLTKLFPVYFNDIGAEGKLRDISTRLDELTHRKDVLVHFLRKQSHVESSNRIINFMQATFMFWETGDKKILESFVPPDIYNQIHPKGDYFDDVHRIVLYLKGNHIVLPDDLLSVEETVLQRLLQGIGGVSERDIERVALMGSLYRLLYQKYTLTFTEMDNYIAPLKADAFPKLNYLEDALTEPDVTKKISRLLDYLDILKEIILSDKTYEIREDIYKKRHITVDIPSMYGSYHELKFDALGLTFRIESIVNVLFEEMVNNIDLTIITKATFYKIYDCLLLFDRALRLDGISSSEVNIQLDFIAHSLEARGFTFTQYIDIFKGFAQAVNNIITDYFNYIHEPNLDRVLSQLLPDEILPKFAPAAGTEDTEKYKFRVSEIFFRDRIAMSLGLQQLDTFISRILNTLFNQSDRLPKDKLHQLLLYDPKRTISSIEKVNKKVQGIIYLGNKGLNLIKLKHYGLPVPAGFIITTEGFRYREIIEGYPPARKNFRQQVANQIDQLEKATGRFYGDAKNPVLVSVRSGSSMSQPGMMDTFLKVGINEQIAEGLAAQTGNSWFAWDNYRRFIQSYGMAFGLERDDFDDIIDEFKRRLSIPFKRDFSGDHMRKVALTYKRMVKDSGIDIPEDPIEQLHMAIKGVFDSWNSPKSITYRKIMGISDDWGTAVTVQQMIFGNLSPESGTGVFFTHNPRRGDDSLYLWGDFTLGNQGEDVVSGLVKTLPISIAQQSVEMRDTDLTLESHFPLIYKALKQWAKELTQKRGWGPQELEFTFESSAVEDLYVLQAREMVMRERDKGLTFDYESISDDILLGHGIGVSGGAMSGRVVFDLEEIDEWRKKEPETSLILVRGDTVPDDIREIYAADGILTARGGATSHAAVVAHRLGKTCVVGCGALVCDEKQKRCSFDDVVLNTGDFISIDGHEGSLYKGILSINRN